MNNHTDTQDLSLKDKLYLGLLRFFSRRSLGLLQGLGRLLGWLTIRAKGIGPYKVVERNLELCFPEKDAAWRRQTTEANLISTGQVMLEFAKTWGMPPAYSVSMIKQVHNEALFMDAINSGRGVLGIVPHFGVWEFLNAWVSERTPPTIIYKPGKDKGVDSFVLEARSRLNATLVPADERGVKATLKTLKKGGFSAILPDHVPAENGGIYAPFFGISTRTAVIVPRLVQRTQCAVVVMSCLRRPDGDGYEIYMDEADPEIYSDDLLTSTAAMNRSIEQLIRRAPEHYQWTYKRFKHNESLPNPYRKS